MYNIHTIKDTSDTYVTTLLRKGLMKVDDPLIKTNYNPLFEHLPQNIFYLLKTGVFATGNYLVLEKEGVYQCSVGWCEYEPDTALIKRAYVARLHRRQDLLANHLLPLIVDQTLAYPKLWMSFNPYNDHIFKWLSRRKHAGLWPDIYHRFAPLGMTTIYNTDQYVMEYERS